MADMPESFHIVIKRDASRGNLVPGHVYLNGKLLGRTYERTEVKIAAGDYKGLLRYQSHHHFVQSANGTMGTKGDFLIEASSVKGRTDILLHTGNQPKHSNGCICLGPILTKDTQDGKIYSVGSDSPLRQLRLAFYGTDQPNASPDKAITISIVDPVSPSYPIRP